jgi:glycosyltransferase involved in cell wall biosynthesis
MAAKVSILLPNLNNVRFIGDRLRSIVLQTYVDWELIIVDGYSDDGAWDLIMDYCISDRRIIATQSTRAGVYAAINECLKIASGEFIYIATSDDTMEPSCIQELVDALERHPSCDIAHCCLRLIDEEGKSLNPNPWDGCYSSRFYGDWLKVEHVRKAPCDAILHAFLCTVYMSLTQLLIRKSLVDKVGCFPLAYGSWGDFAWGMKASLLGCTIHVPRYLATWRVHASQATARDVTQNPALFLAYLRMIDDVLDSAKNDISSLGQCVRDRRRLKYCYRLWIVSLLSRGQKQELSLRMQICLILELVRDPRVAKAMCLSFLYRNFKVAFDPVIMAKQYLRKAGLLCP